MIDKSTRKQLAERKERVRRRINTKVDPENYEFIPAKKPIDYYDNDIRQRVAVYARVSTDNVQQTSSYELQKKYYEDFVVHQEPRIQSGVPEEYFRTACAECCGTL